MTGIVNPMDISQLSQSLKLKWLNYYEQNRSWLIKIKIWDNYDGHRRPTSSFILAIISVLEPQLEQIFPFILELSNDPDKMIAALGLNFNPEEELRLLQFHNHETKNPGDEEELPDEYISFPQPVKLFAEVMDGENDVAVEEKDSATEEAVKEPLRISTAEQDLPIPAKRNLQLNLSAWIDNFCQGTRLETGEVISIPQSPNTL